MFGVNATGVWNRQALFWGKEYGLLFFIAVIASLPLMKTISTRLEQSQTGPAMAFYRLGEKIIPAVLLLLSIAYVVEASYNPFLYFRF